MKIVEVGAKLVVKRIKCPQCNSILEYYPSDVKSMDVSSSPFHASHILYIECPLCRKFIPESEGYVHEATERREEEE